MRMNKEEIEQYLKELCHQIEVEFNDGAFNRKVDDVRNVLESSKEEQKGDE